MDTNILRGISTIIFIQSFLHQTDSVHQGEQIFLINAVNQMNVEIMQWLLNEQAIIDVQDSKGMTALMHAAAIKNSSDVVQILMDAGANQDVRDNEGSTALHVAAQNGSLETLKLFSYNDTSRINKTDNQGRTPLHFALMQDDEKVLSYLLENNLDPYIQDNHGLTIIHLAAMTGKTSILQILKNKGKDLDSVANGTTPLMLAIIFGKKDTAQFLIENGAKSTFQDSKLWTPLHGAASSGHLQLVELLIDNSTNIDVINSDERTPLYLAVENGHFPVAKYLIDKGANITLTDSYGNNLLHAAAHSGNTKMVEYFIDTSIELDKTNNNGTTPLIVASIKGHESLVELFIRKEANANAMDKNGMSLVFAAAQLGNINLLKQVQKLYGNLSFDVQNLEDITPLHYASQSDSIALVEFIINAMAENYFLKTHDTEIRPKRALSFKLKVCPICYKNIINRRDLNGKTPIYYAAATGKADILMLLHSYGGNVSMADNNGQSPLHIATVNNQNLDTLNFLALHTPNINNKDFKGKTALFLSAEAGQIKSIKYLIDVGANISIRDNQGWTTIHAAAANGHTAVISELGMQQIEMVNSEDNEGKTPAWHAINNGHWDTLNKLILLGAQIKPQINEFEAAKNGQMNIINYLFTKCNSPLGRNSKGQTLLHVAAAAGQTLVIKELSKYRCLINRTDDMMKTPAWYALNKENWDSLEQLVEYGAVIYPLVNISEVIRLGQLGIIQYIFDKDSEAYKKYHEPLIFIASEAGQYNIVKYLIEFGVDVNISKDGVTPLYKAVENGNCYIVELLLQNGAEDPFLRTRRAYYHNYNYLNCKDKLRMYGIYV